MSSALAKARDHYAESWWRPVPPSVPIGSVSGRGDSGGTSYEGSPGAVRVPLSRRSGSRKKGVPVAEECTTPLDRSSGSPVSLHRRVWGDVPRKTDLGQYRWFRNHIWTYSGEGEGVSTSPGQSVYLRRTPGTDPFRGWCVGDDDRNEGAGHGFQDTRVFFTYRPRSSPSSWTNTVATVLSWGLGRECFTSSPKKVSRGRPRDSPHVVGTVSEVLGTVSTSPLGSSPRDCSCSTWWYPEG